MQTRDISQGQICHLLVQEVFSIVCDCFFLKNATVLFSDVYKKYQTISGANSSCFAILDQWGSPNNNFKRKKHAQKLTSDKFYLRQNCKKDFPKKKPIKISCIQSQSCNIGSSIQEHTYHLFIQSVTYQFTPLSSSKMQNLKQYEVEQIVDECKQDNRTLYLVKWVGYPHEENTWEPRKHLLKALNKIEEWKVLRDAREKGIAGYKARTGKNQQKIRRENQKVIEVNESNYNKKKQTAKKMPMTSQNQMPLESQTLLKKIFKMPSFKAPQTKQLLLQNTRPSQNKSISKLQKNKKKATSSSTDKSKASQLLHSTRSEHIFETKKTQNLPKEKSIHRAVADKNKRRKIKAPEEKHFSILENNMLKKQSKDNSCLSVQPECIIEEQQLPSKPEQPISQGNQGNYLNVQELLVPSQQINAKPIEAIPDAMLDESESTIKENHQLYSTSPCMEPYFPQIQELDSSNDVIFDMRQNEPKQDFFSEPSQEEIFNVWFSENHKLTGQDLVGKKRYYLEVTNIFERQGKAYCEVRTILGTIELPYALALQERPDLVLQCYQKHYKLELRAWHLQ